MVDVFIKKLNSVYVQLICEKHILKELENAFKFRPPGYQFVPSFKARYWDGWLRLINVETGIITHGLWNQVKKECEVRGYKVGVDKSLTVVNPISDNMGYELATLFNAKYEPRDYQNAAVVEALRTQRRLLLSPTASGKSLIIYLVTRFLVEELQKKVLIIVPTVSLTKQMASDFTDYNNGKDIGVHEISAGVSKQTDKNIVVSTWQSLTTVSADYLSQFGAVIVDEAHLAKATSITKLLEKMIDCEWKLGFTGTIQDDGPVNKLVLEGLFGQVYQVTKTHELIENKTLADFEIKAIVLKHKKQKLKNYQEEIDYIVANEKRNKFIVNLASNLKGNTLILFQLVDKHGIPLFELLKETGKNVHFIHGGIDGDERETIRHEINNSEDNILLASVGTTSTGTNIVSLDNLIMCHPTKSKIRNLQSIGRILRKNGDNKAVLYDLVDFIGNGTNYSITHFEERVKQYTNEQFDYKLYNVELDV